MPFLRIALGQLNTSVGDVAGNKRRIAQAILCAQSWFADVVIVPELAITGYPPEDLLLNPRFVEDNLKALKDLARTSCGITALVGFVDRDADGKLYSAAGILANGRHVATYRKMCLPNYGVFDEHRYFTPGDKPLLIEVGRVRLGVSICEDLWEAESTRVLVKSGAQVLVNLSASPYHAGKLRERERLLSARVRQHHVPIAYCNLVGGQDELIFDGASLIFDARGNRLARGLQFSEDLILADLAQANRGTASRDRKRTHSRMISISGKLTDRPSLPHEPIRRLAPVEEVYEALTLGVRDYAHKNGFKAVVLGISGGIDSSLTAAIAVDALGSEHVVGVVMPSRFSSQETQKDAKRLASALEIRCEGLSIEPAFQAYLEMLRPVTESNIDKSGRVDIGVTGQNIQARIRGNMLMALSNRFGWLVLTTGNKSEMATGYCTLYGDMAGGLAVLKDVPKTLVYQLARYRNKRGPKRPIPRTVLERAPTAELAPGQNDQQTLPPYDMLDRIIRAYVEEDSSLQEILSSGRLNPAVVRRTIKMIDRSEYKRRQGPPGIKITPKAFGKDRRMPITNRYESN